MLQDFTLGPDTVDVSMETLASVWAPDPCVLSDPGEKRHVPSTVWESPRVLSRSPPAGLTWTEQFSPHLQRNRQLHDTLLQREEELVRLQEENIKLREFLTSSFVRNLQEKAKKLPIDRKRKLKRNLMHVDERPLQICGHQHVASQHVSKRVCRNLTAEFCSESSETSSSSEPNLDLWVLRTLGLKDRDTIDTSADSLSSPGHSLNSFGYDAAVTSSSSSPTSSACSLNSFNPSAAASLPHSVCQSSTHQTKYQYSPVQCQESNHSDPAQNCTLSPGQNSNFTAKHLSAQCGEAPKTAFHCPPVTDESPFTQSPDTAEICTVTALSQALCPQGNLAYHPANWSPLEGSRTPSKDTIPFSQPGERISFSPVSSSSPINMKQHWTPGWTPMTPSEESLPPATPETPRTRTDLAFSMSLSPSSSVKTHSFPQGQAFVRKDMEGRWNFTWLPRQGP
ncbi:hypothetical protein JOB18_023539 [Solea senegalensis]|nr:geminin coiled-coil domain-containing protein 1 [Solea senegalensis]KAG7479346.1 hypothetical protein JOB18_023539 [Solea senegalensis]KAG7479347.1 hypothetical protein JOB18_023539 [Solea senegalensis]